MRHTKHDSLSGRKAVRRSELDLPTKEEMRRVERWLSGKPDRTELPKRVNIEERKRKNRKRAKAVKRVARWKRKMKRKYNAYMRDYMKKRRLAAKADIHKVGGV